MLLLVLPPPLKVTRSSYIILHILFQQLFHLSQNSPPSPIDLFLRRPMLLLLWRPACFNISLALLGVFQGNFLLYEQFFASLIYFMVPFGIYFYGSFHHSCYQVCFWTVPVTPESMSHLGKLSHSRTYRRDCQYS